MRPDKHILSGAVFSAAVFLLFPRINLFWILILFLSTFLIDFDHYLYYVFRKKNASPIKAYSWYMRNKKKFYSLPAERMKEFYGGIYIFHGLEQMIILLLAGIFMYKPILLIFAGFLFHLLLDWYDELKYDIVPIKLSIVSDTVNSGKLKHIEDI